MKNFLIKIKSPQKPSQDYIQTMFNGLARRYDAFTFLTGFGQANRWRQKTLAPLREGMRVLDLGCGTGDLALLAYKKTEGRAIITGLDFSENMIQIASNRFQNIKSGNKSNLSFIQKKAEDLPIAGEEFDLIVSGFVLRNLYENIDKILKGVLASLAPGGRIRFLDLTEPQNPWLKRLFRFYMIGVVGFYGTILFGKKYPISYLPDSAGRFFASHDFVILLKKHGFMRVSATSFVWGSVTLYEGFKST